MKKTFEADVKHCVRKIIEDYLFYCFLFFMSCSKWRCNSFCSFTRIIYDAHKKVSLVQNSCQKFSKDSFLFFSVLILRIVRLLATLKAYLYCGWNKNTRLSVIQNASSVRFTLWSDITSHKATLLTQRWTASNNQTETIPNDKIPKYVIFKFCT